jgi:hypothetical protein
MSFAAVGAASLGVIFGALDITSLMLIAASAALGTLVRRWVSGFSGTPFIQPLCAALIADIVAAVSSLYQPIATALVAFCPCMALVPGPHLLNGAIDLVRTWIALRHLLLDAVAHAAVPHRTASSSPSSRSFERNDRGSMVGSVTS